MKYVITLGREVREVDITGADGHYHVAIGGESYTADARLTAPGIYSVLVNGASWIIAVADRDGQRIVDVAGESYTLTVEEQTRWVLRSQHGAIGGGGSRTLSAPLPGKISRVAVRPGDTVKAGDTLLVIEAMKMENEFKAAAEGRVAEVRVAAGQAVNAGDVLVVLT